MHKPSPNPALLPMCTWIGVDCRSDGENATDNSPKAEDEDEDDEDDSDDTDLCACVSVCVYVTVENEWEVVTEEGAMSGDVEVGRDGDDDKDESAK